VPIAKYLPIGTCRVKSMWKPVVEKNPLRLRINNTSSVNNNYCGRHNNNNNNNNNVLLYTSKRLPFLLTGLWDVHATHCTRTCSRRSLSITSYGCYGTGWSSSIRQWYFTTGYVNLTEDGGWGWGFLTKYPQGIARTEHTITIFFPRFTFE